jgi:hypothetical protein
LHCGPSKRSYSTRTGTWRRALKVAGVLAASLIAVDYVAGRLFLKSLHHDVRGATPLTLAQYGYYYGDRPQIRHRLLAAVASIAALAALSVYLLRRRRTLHGDARFAAIAVADRSAALCVHGSKRSVKRRYGYRRIHVLLRREGWAISRKRTYRLYREAGLAVQRRKRKRVGPFER